MLVYIFFIFLRLLFFKSNAFGFIVVYYHSFSLSQLGLECSICGKVFFSRSQIEMTLITIGCITTLHHCVKYNNFQPLFSKLLIGKMCHPHSNVSTPNYFQCLLYFTSLHDLTLCLVFSYLALFISCFKLRHFLHNMP